MSLAHDFYRNQQLKESSVVGLPSLKSELERLKLCFGQFSDIRNGVKPPTKSIDESKEEAQPKGFFQQAFGYISSIFEKKKTNTTNNCTTIAVGTNIFSTNPNPLYDVMYKVVMDGSWGVGKTSYLRCLVEKDY